MTENNPNQNFLHALAMRRCRCGPISVSRHALAGLRRLAVVVGFATLVTTSPVPSPATTTLAPVDTALVIAVDVSNSVDDRRYRLQMNGIAAALEDPAVVGTILNGAQGAILVSLVAWSDHPRIAMDWLRISSKREAAEVANRIRNLNRISGEFTCVSDMLRYLNDKVLPVVPAPALRKVVDVSGDGSDNCNSRVAASKIRDEIVSYGTTINGLPILEGPEAATLEDWYEDNIKGGPGSFVLAADGFEDFGRAIRQKFIVEISGLEFPRSGRMALKE